jgi:hypothetical protein
MSVFYFMSHAVIQYDLRSFKRWNVRDINLYGDRFSNIDTNFKFSYHRLCNTYPGI